MAGAIPPHLRRRLLIDLSMLALAVASLGLVLFEIVAEGSLTAEERLLLDLVDLGVVVIFVVEFVVSARRSREPWRYVKRNWYDLPSMIWLPGTLLQGFVSLRLLRFVRLIRVLRTLARLRRVSQHVQSTVLQERVVYIALVGIATILFGAMSAFVVEQGENPQDWSFEDALWWSVVTTATVGYGDLYPVTTAGRLVGIVLMIVGVGIIGSLAGNLAQRLLHRREARRRKRIYSRWHAASDE